MATNTEDKTNQLKADLEILNNFRKEYLIDSKEGKEILKDGKKLSDKIFTELGKKEADLKFILYVAEVSKTCIELIKANEPERAVNEYRFMIKNLKKFFKI